MSLSPINPRMWYDKSATRLCRWKDIAKAITDETICPTEVTRLLKEHPPLAKWLARQHNITIDNHGA